MKPYALLALLCCACATTPPMSFADAAQRWVGQPESALLAAKGEPNRTLTRSYEGGELIEKTLEYRGQAVIRDQGRSSGMMKPVLINGQWVMVPEESVISSASPTTDCTLTFTVDRDRVVRSWKAEGKSCRN